jgi:hypothetical protein
VVSLYNTSFIELFIQFLCLLEPDYKSADYI